MNCDCYTKTNEKLKDQNLQLAGYTFLMPSFDMVPQIKTSWIDKSKSPNGMKLRPPQMIASHCPFCGKLATKGTK